MVTIGNTEPMLALVRSQLERLAKGRTGRASAKSAATTTAAAATDRLQVIAGLADLPEEQFKRTLIGALLTEEFGEEVAADPRFQSVIDRAAEMMKDDPRLTQVMTEVRQGLRPGP